MRKSIFCSLVGGRGGGVVGGREGVDKKVFFVLPYFSIH